MTPGSYLAKRRAAAGLSVAEVAARLATTPRIAEHARAGWIEQVESGAPARFDTIVALRAAFRFDLDVLTCLAAIDLGANGIPPRLCLSCACSTYDGCRTAAGPCDWVDAVTPLCTACVQGEPAATAAERSAA